MRIVVTLTIRFDGVDKPMDMTMSIRGFWQWIRTDFFRKVLGLHFGMDFVSGTIVGWKIKGIIK